MDIGKINLWETNKNEILRECDISSIETKADSSPKLRPLSLLTLHASRNNETLMNHNGDYDAGGNTVLHRLQEMLLITQATLEDGAYIMSWCTRSCTLVHASPRVYEGIHVCVII